MLDQHARGGPAGVVRLERDPVAERPDELDAQRVQRVVGVLGADERLGDAAEQRHVAAVAVALALHPQAVGGVLDHQQDDRLGLLGARPRRGQVERAACGGVDHDLAGGLVGAQAGGDRVEEAALAVV